MAKKATRAGVKETNRRLILRSVFTGSATSRAAISQQTKLTKPTVSELVSELIEEGLLEEGGRGESTESGGKRPRLLHFHHEARQIIGVSITSVRAHGVLADLSGNVIARHSAELKGEQQENAIHVLQEVINGLLAQLDAPLLCISVGVPGIVQSGAGIVKAAPELGWYSLTLGERLAMNYDVPVYVGNNTELAARAQASFSEERIPNLVMILVNISIEIGIAFGKEAYHHSGDLGLLRVPPEGEQLTGYLGWAFVKRRVDELRQMNPDTDLPMKPTYLDIYYGYQGGDWLCKTLVNELAVHLGQIFAWITGLIRPDHIVLAGGVVEIGEPLLQLATQYATELLPPDLVNAVTFSLSEDQSLSVTGTLAHALARELGVL